MVVKDSPDKESGYSEDVYQAALQYFNAKVFQESGFSIENDYVKEHKDELCYCYEHDKTLIDFDWWCRYEELLKTRITYEEYRSLDNMLDADPMDIRLEDTKTVKALQKHLHILRGDYIEGRDSEEPNLDLMIRSAEEKTVNQFAMTEETIYQAVYDKFQKSNRVFEAELSELSFEECAHNRINRFSEIVKNVKERA